MDFNPEILYRFFKGQYSRNDFQKLKSAFENPELQTKLREEIQKHWSEFADTQQSTDNIDQILHKIHQQIATESKNVRANRFITLFQRIAAILIIPLTISFFAALYFQSKAQITETAIAEIQCPRGVQTKFTLPDGTTGFLNSGSTLSYPVRFSGDRNVTLRGEAFFDVAHDKTHPFVVNTPNLKTLVLGTQFNVIAYQDESIEEVILNEGKVEVYNNKGMKLNVLKPNQNLILNTQNNTCAVKEVDSEQYISWTKGKLVFRNESLLEVSKRLGRRYNIEIEIEDSELLNYAFRATFVDEPVEEILKILTKTAPMNFKEQKRKMSTDDIFTKRKFIISLDKRRLHFF